MQCTLLYKVNDVKLPGRLVSLEAAGHGRLCPSERYARRRVGSDRALKTLRGLTTARYVDDRELKGVRFENFWMVRHFPGSFSPVHFHSGDVSGVLYLKIPESIENEPAELRKSYISARRAGYITFLIGGKQRFSKSLISFKPVVGDLYIFPGWLLHAVEPFAGVGERRSMSFNAFVE